MNLTADQIIILGIASSVIAQVIKWISDWQGKDLDRKWATAILFVVSLGLAFVWTSWAIPALPVFVGDPMTDTASVLAWAGSLLAMLSPIVGFAMAIYNLLLEKVFGAAKDAAQSLLHKGVG
jgi:hypothetical protein